MARPSPVVSVGTELADAPRRAGHKTDILIDIVLEQDVLVAVVEGHDLHAHVAGTLPVCFQPFAVLGNLLLAVGFGHFVGDALEHCLRHILYVVEEQDGKAFIGEFLVFAVSPEAVFQVVVLHGGVGLHLTEAAMVVGEQQTFGGDKLAGAAATELHDSVLEAGLVEAEDLLGRQLAAKPLHISEILSVDRIGQPHALVGAGAQEKHHQCDAQEVDFLCHGDNNLKTQK